jgi:16S rRNA (guanine966-N2)-methyltransferase
MRVVAGRFKGRSLAAPQSLAIRPTSDRLRETVFNLLAHGAFLEGRDVLSGALALDLFAGTGALGIEALSRGAAYCAFVDIGAEARGLIRANIEAFGLGGVTRLLKRDATRLGAIETFAPFTLVFADPPYGKGLGEAALASALAGGWIARGAVVVLEERHDARIALPDDLKLLDRRIVGEAQVLFASAGAEVRSGKG